MRVKNGDEEMRVIKTNVLKIGSVTESEKLSIYGWIGSRITVEPVT